MVSKACKITIEDFRVILVLEFNNRRTKIFQFGVLKKKMNRIMKTDVEVEASLCDFFDNW